MNKNKPINILAIETSCDETAASVLRGVVGSKEPEFFILSSVVRSQIKIHSKFGGVVPEVAARAHVRAIRPVVEKSLSIAGLKLGAVDCIAVTSGPGLIASLIVGVEFAKGLSMATGKPMIAVNHMEGHLYSPMGAVGISNFQLPISNQITKAKAKTAKIEFPILSMIVSGGHTLLVLQKNESHYQVLGSTVDDAAGEAFDKVAKLLELPYPGGPEISKLAEVGQDIITFPRPMINAPNFDFSFSGLKTAVLYYLKETYPKLSTVKVLKDKPGSHHFNFGRIRAKDKANIAKSFEMAVVDVLVSKAMRAAKKYGCKTISLAGGVAANKRLRATLSEQCAVNSVQFVVPDFKLCTDNAEMIALAAYFKLRSGYKTVYYSKVKADSSWELE